MFQSACIALESRIRMLEYRNSRLSDSGRKTFSPHIQRIQPHLRQRFVDASFRFLIGLVLRRHFGYDEQLLAGHTARADALAHAALIAVGLRRIDMAIPRFYCRPHGLSGVCVVDEPCGKPQLWNFHAVSQCQILRIHVCTFRMLLR